MNSLLLLLRLLANSLRNISSYLKDSTTSPSYIDDTETLVRAIKKLNLKGGTLKYNAFVPPRGKSDISVMRPKIMGDEKCISKAKEILPEKNTVLSYVGVAILLAGNARSMALVVEDSPDVFPGHAQIDLGLGIYPPSLNEASSAEIRKKFNEKAEQLKRKSSLLLDPNPDSPSWNGPRLDAIA